MNDLIWYLTDAEWFGTRYGNSNSNGYGYGYGYSYGYGYGYGNSNGNTYGYGYDLAGRLVQVTKNAVVAARSLTKNTTWPTSTGVARS